MKILWLTNYPLPSIAVKTGLPVTVNEGWLVGLLGAVIQKEWDIVLCSSLDSIGEDMYFQEQNISFYGIKNEFTHRYNKKLKGKFADILLKENPDIVHIMGSEFPHSYSMFEACKRLNWEGKCVVSIQGLISKIAQAYDLGIEADKKKKRVVWDFLVKDSILLNKKEFSYRGYYEKMLFSQVKNVIGRTEWDYLCVKQMNPSVQYYKCNEILRDVFYQNCWDYDKCEKHSIIISQATYPVKGFHILLKAAAMLTDKYDDLKIFVPSQTVYPKAMKRNRLLNSDYANYIIGLIKEHGLEKHIEFLGSLDAENMCKAYLKSNVFVCPSTIENSSNSLGEAMLLGMPIVASYVGGLGSMFVHEKEGLFFPLEEEYMLSAYIDILFRDIDKAESLGRESRVKAFAAHNAEKNMRDIVACYENIRRQFLFDEIKEDEESL